VEGRTLEQWAEGKLSVLVVPVHVVVEKTLFVANACLRQNHPCTILKVGGGDLVYYNRRLGWVGDCEVVVEVCYVYSKKKRHILPRN
jgi:hypothetical protein